MSERPHGARAQHWLAQVLIVAALVTVACPLLFRGLRARDLGNDEAIYSYVVDRMLATGDWLTLENPYGGLFHEKPPLKFWLVAAGIASGLPHDELGLRLWDTGFALITLLYVVAIGRRLDGAHDAGLTGGLAAALLLLADSRLLFEHGVRSNNMESMLLLAYCGGVWHFLAWTTATSTRGRRAHAIAVGAWTAFAFLGKFIAAAFLPAIVAVAALAHGPWRRLARTDWRSWLVSAVVALVAIAPWFAYATARYGRVYLDVLFGDQVFQRFTAYLEPHHLEPWSFYLTELWHSFTGLHLVLVVGVCAFTVRLARGRWPVGVLLLVWFALPMVVLSVTTSKLYHYIYPFLPPVALAGGYLMTVVVSQLTQSLATPTTTPPGVRLALKLLTVVALIMVAVTVVHGPLTTTTPFGALKSSSVTRPLVVAALAVAWLGGGARATASTAVLAWFAITLSAPIVRNLERTTRPEREVRDLVDCLRDAGDGKPLIRVHFPTGVPLINNLYYYSYQLPLTRSDDPSPQALRTHLESTPPGAVFLWDQDLDRLRADQNTARAIDAVVRRRILNTWLLLPPPYDVCRDD